MRMLLLVLAIFIAGIMAGCSASSDATATKKEEATFRDRDPSHMKGPPAGFSPSGPPPGASGPPPGAPGSK